MFKGYKTYIAVGVGILFSVGRLLGIDFGLSETEVVESIETIITLIALVFIRLGIKNGPTV